MTKRSMKSGIDVLDDLVSFFESSTAFISVPCEKMRRTHGPNFKLATVKAILALRTDLTKEERAHALKVCEEILEDFKRNPQYDTLHGQKAGIFNNLDMTQAAAQAQKDETEVKDEENDENEAGEFNLDDFLKQGGIDLD